MGDIEDNNQKLPADTKLLVMDHVDKILKKKMSLITIISTIIIAMGGFSIYKVIERTCTGQAKIYAEDMIGKEFEKQQKNIQQQYTISQNKVSSYEKNLELVMNLIHDREEKALRSYDELISNIITLNIKVQTSSEDAIEQIKNIIENITEANSKITNIESSVKKIDNNQEKTTPIIKNDIYKKVKTELSKGVTNNSDKIDEFTKKLLDIDLPVGTILPFSGKEEHLSEALSSGWRVCDGSDGTPNLISKFLYGGLSEEIGQTGGTLNHDHAGITTPDNGPNFTHTGMGGSEGSRPKHIHTLDIGPASHMPPYYKVIFIIKTKRTIK